METPRFEWVRMLENRTETRLFISDSALGADKELYLSWYFGTAHDNVQQRLATYIQHVADKIGATTIILFGHSAGGYASIALGQRIRNSRALAFNPQVHIDRWPYCTTFIKRVFGETKSFADLDQEFPERTNLLRLLESKKSYERLVVVQNTGDDTHLVPQFASLASFLGVPEYGGISSDGAIQLVTEDHGLGHIAPPAARVHAWIDALIN
ncbi:YqiA/YcfP family alpha/beta fold hydrolase [Arthrobacter sp. Sr24]